MTTQASVAKKVLDWLEMGKITNFFYIFIEGK